MKQEIRNRIIRRLGGVPIDSYPNMIRFPGYELIPVESVVQQDLDRISVTVKYDVRKPENCRRAKK